MDVDSEKSSEKSPVTLLRRPSLVMEWGEDLGK